MLYAGTLVTAAVVVLVIAASERPWAAIALASAPLAIGPTKLALGEARGRDLLPMLAGTARLQLCAGALLAIGILI
jgi:1,4-dihydroxy-2-naphthoate octaprenyltransferase